MESNEPVEEKFSLESDVKSSDIDDQQHSTIDGSLINTSVKPMKRRRRSSPPNVNDPRLFYVDNLMDALQSGDKQILRETFQRQNTPDCIFIQRYTNDTVNFPAYREIRGIDKMVEFYGTLQMIVPDMVVKVSGRQLNLFEDGSCYLVTKMQCHGVRVFPMIVTNLARATRRFLSNINPLAALRGYFFGQLKVRQEAAEKAQMQVNSSSSSAGAGTVSFDEFTAASEEKETTTQKQTSGFAQVCTPETRFEVVPDRNQPPIQVSATVSSLSFINREGQIFKNESFFKVETRIAPYWVFTGFWSNETNNNEETEEADEDLLSLFSTSIEQEVMQDWEEFSEEH